MRHPTFVTWAPLIRYAYTVSEEIAWPHTLPGAGGHRPHLPRPRNGEEAMMEEKYTPVRELPEGKFGAMQECIDTDYTQLRN